MGAFNVIQLEHATAIVAGAEALGLPVVLQISENCVRYHGALEPDRARLRSRWPGGAEVPVAVHLDHATDRALVEEAVELGLGSVMFDASALPDEENVDRHRRAWPPGATSAACGWRPSWARWAARTACTRPAPAPSRTRRPTTWRRTGVDALAVAVGTSHAMTTKDAVLDLALIAELRAAVTGPAGAARLLRRARRHPARGRTRKA